MTNDNDEQQTSNKQQTIMTMIMTHNKQKINNKQ